MIFTAKQDTFLKKAPIESRFLSDQGKRSFRSGDDLAVSQMDEIPADSHAWVKLNGTNDKWVIYLPHWQEKTAKPAGVVQAKIDWKL